jgi:hypothetical protein
MKSGAVSGYCVRTAPFLIGQDSKLSSLGAALWLGYLLGAASPFAWIRWGTTESDAVCWGCGRGGNIVCGEAGEDLLRIGD